MRKIILINVFAIFQLELSGSGPRLVKTLLRNMPTAGNIYDDQGTSLSFNYRPTTKGRIYQRKPSTLLWTILTKMTFFCLLVFEHHFLNVFYNFDLTLITMGTFA